MTMRSRFSATQRGRTYHLARSFGRGRLFAAWLELRFLLTGRTGWYRVF